MMNNGMTSEEYVNEFIDDLYTRQFDEWPDVNGNYMRLSEVKRRNLRLGDFGCAVQCNPARIVSTGAKTDTDSISRRKCFLCAANRPDRQLAIPMLGRWELLVNPYPIFPVHFTIASTDHRPQASVPLDMASMAEMSPGLAYFFNGAHAGASAPDHLHVQAVLRCELPLVRLVEENHPADHTGFMCSEDYGLDLPFQFVSAVISPDQKGMDMLLRIHGAFGIDAATGAKDAGLVNAYFWIADDRLLRVALVPRRRHRPELYGSGESQYLVSPGAVDMAGVIITPRPEDFERLTADDISQIYADVAFANRLPDEIKLYFGL